MGADSMARNRSRSSSVAGTVRRIARWCCPSLSMCPHSVQCVRPVGRHRLMAYVWLVSVHFGGGRRSLH